jgi:signal transduction histidine kinase
VSFVGVALRNVRRLELERQLVEELEGTIERRRDLVSSVTHELRTPLVCIEGFAAALHDNWASFDDPDRRDLVTRIGAHAAELDVLVSELLDFSATERGALRAELARIPLRETVEEIIAGLRPLIGDRPVRIDVPDVEVIADGDLLGRTLSNLVSNAVKYSDPGTAVVVTGTTRREVARIEVVDEGIGMTEDDLANAFEPFWRGGPPGTQRVRGTGIGLALVAEYVRLMGGAHGARSTPGRGSTFHFTLPIADTARSSRPLSRHGTGGDSA